MGDDDFVLSRIGEELKRKGLYQSHIARSLGMTNAWISKILNGKRRLSVDVLLKIADILEVDPASLLPESKHKKLMNFEEYIRAVIRDEIIKYNEKGEE